MESGASKLEMMYSSGEFSRRAYVSETRRTSVLINGLRFRNSPLVCNTEIIPPASGIRGIY